VSCYVLTFSYFDSPWFRKKMIGFESFDYSSLIPKPKEELR
jgi:hypothetical protein